MYGNYLRTLKAQALRDAAAELRRQAEAGIDAERNNILAARLDEGARRVAEDTDITEETGIDEE